MEPVKPVDPLRAPPPSSTYRKGEKKSKKKLKAHKMPSPHDTPPADQVFGTMSDAGSVVGMPVGPNYIDPMTRGYAMDPSMMAMKPNMAWDRNMMNAGMGVMQPPKSGNGVTAKLSYDPMESRGASQMPKTALWQFLIC